MAVLLVCELVLLPVKVSLFHTQTHASCILDTLEKEQQPSQEEEEEERKVRSIIEKEEKTLTILSTIVRFFHQLLRVVR